MHAISKDMHATLDLPNDVDSSVQRMCCVCRERRLKHQLDLTNDAKLQKMGKKLCDNLEHFFEGVEVLQSA